MPEGQKTREATPASDGITAGVCDENTASDGITAASNCSNAPVSSSAMDAPATSPLQGLPASSSAMDVPAKPPARKSPLVDDCWEIIVDALAENQKYIEFCNPSKEVLSSKEEDMYLVS